MGPIEVMWSVVVIMFVFIGFARGYHRELGATIVILIALMLFSLFGSRLEEVGRSIFRFADPETQNLILMILFQTIFLAISFSGYSGETLKFAGQPPSGCSGSILNGFFGGLNGFMIAGTLWYYLAYFKYPVPSGLFNSAELTDFAKNIQAYLPPTWPATLLFIWLALLIVLRVRR